MKTLYALLIGISRYPNPADQLDEPVKELRALHHFLKTNIKDGFRLEVKELTDQQATRDNIIRGFQHLKKAQNGDICLLYFAGHGSWVKASLDQLHMEGDTQLESIVCYNSRQTGGQDIIDKELSYLIGEVVNKKNIHFTAIMDCCFSGDNTREENLEENLTQRKVRTLPANYSAVPLNHFYGYNEFHKKNKKRSKFSLWISRLFGAPRPTYPPKSPHIQMAACPSDKRAYDGVFSHYLLKELEADSQRSYADLLQAIQRRIPFQHPQLYASKVNMKEAPFLLGAV